MTFPGAEDVTGLRVLDVTATLDPAKRELAVFIVNRSEHDAQETILTLHEGTFAGPVIVHTVNGDSVKAFNSFENPSRVTTTSTELTASGRNLSVTLEPHSVTALICSLQ